MNQRERNALDRHITGNYGEDQFRDAIEECPVSAHELLAALEALEQAYSNRHSPQHRAACLAHARSVITRAKEAT